MVRAHDKFPNLLSVLQVLCAGLVAPRIAFSIVDNNQFIYNTRSLREYNSRRACWYEAKYDEAAAEKLASIVHLFFFQREQISLSSTEKTFQILVPYAP